LISPIYTLWSGRRYISSYEISGGEDDLDLSAAGIGGFELTDPENNGSVDIDSSWVICSGAQQKAVPDERKERTMTAKQMLLLYLITLAVFFMIDMIWLGVVAKGFYRRHLGPMLSPKVNWAAAVLFYLLFIVGLVVFVIKPALVGGEPLKALLFGALFGLISYATYDLSNLATLKDWPLVVTIVDLIWGTVLGGAVSFAGALIGRSLLKL
jgi:uncharacterized membrane protein